MNQDRRCYIGIDVGTGSARAGVFDTSGKMLGQSSRPIKMWKPQADFVEQSSETWAASAAAVRQAVTEADIDATNLRGIGFDATCSLVALDERDRPVSVSPTGEDKQNISRFWMDHRALEQTARTTDGGHAVLRDVGGMISPEMESPKLIWLRENLPDCWNRARRFFDLADF